ncbi:MAG TPA: hypothetical protein VF807_13960, partial [Ktedonobacterales bacterium]
ETLRLVASPDELVEHRPSRCSACHTPLHKAAEILRERRQVQDLPPLRLLVPEHQVVHLRCPAPAARRAVELPSRAIVGITPPSANKA